MKIDADRLRRWGLGLVAALFLMGAAGENLPGVKLPLGSFHLWNDWNMFSTPGSPQLVFVIGQPREGGEPRVIVNPLERPARFVDRWRDAREDKLHELLAKATVPIAVRQSYLARMCALHGRRYSQIALRTKAKDSSPGLLVAERSCN